MSKGKTTMIININHRRKIRERRSVVGDVGRQT
jgi:hypothetical protein